MSKGICSTEGCKKKYDWAVSFTPPYCSSCLSERHNKPKFRIKIHFDWRYRHFPYFWDVQQLSKDGRYDNIAKGGCAATRRGAIRMAKRQFKKYRKGGYSEAYFDLEGNRID